MTKEDLRRLHPPDSPGVYLMRDQHQKIIYIGKAVSLGKRLASYFRSPENLDPKTRALVAKIHTLEFVVTDSEVEALILENTLIKKHQPRYNVLLRDDKSYPYLKLTVQEDFPRLLMTRKPFADDALYFGPFAAAGPLKEAVRAVARHFRLCQLKHAIRRHEASKRVCLYHQMGQCDGACMGLITPAAYARKVRAVRGFLEGGLDPISPGIQARMEQAAEAQQYENAARLRDQLEVLQRIRHQPAVSSTHRENRDVFGLARSGNLAAVEVFFVRAGKLEGRRHFYLRGAGAHADSAVLSQVLTQYYSQPVMVPAEIVLPLHPDDEGMIQSWLASGQRPPVNIRLPADGEAQRLLKMAENNAWLHLKHQAEGSAAELSEENRKILTDLAARLGLSGPPLLVEGYDISNIAGQDAVGSRVVFCNGHPDKNKYRRYRIRSVEGPNDFAMLQEVLFRRLRRLQQGRETPPDLIVVDGGAGQLSAARAVLQDLQFSHLPVIGLAKKEEAVYLAGQKEPLLLPKNSQALGFLTRLRDEAHRFAITYHRHLRGRRMKLSDLDLVPGLGVKRRRVLLRAFGSVESLLQVDTAELAKVEGIGLALARRIQDTLKKKYTGR
ncbi:excinuclease ABC subunit UvrC [candidate division FCPU426 bacterium]|nr:excinuclease ABC subunit UvrC [candidate division FCPU426 bacterium]